MNSKPTPSDSQIAEKFENDLLLTIAKNFGPLTKENAAVRIQVLTNILIDWHAMNPQTPIDNGAWEHLLVYAPKEVLQSTLDLKNNQE